MTGDLWFPLRLHAADPGCRIKRIETAALITSKNRILGLVFVKILSKLEFRL